MGALFRHRPDYDSQSERALLMLYGIQSTITRFGPTPPADINYVTDAVNFDGSCYLQRGAALTGFGTPDKITFSVWTKISFQGGGLFNDSNVFQLVQNSNTPFPGDDAYFCLYGGGGGSGFDTIGTATITSGAWQGLFLSVDITNQIAHFYRGDTSVIHSPFFDTPAATPTGTDFFFGNDGFGNLIAGDIADFRLWVGQYIDLSLQGNRRMFVRSNGKPADPAAIKAALGNPIIEFVADGTTPVANFQTNTGTGGAFTLNGAGSMTLATTSPTD